MKHIGKTKENNINTIIPIVKISMLVFVVIIVYQNLSSYHSFINKKNGYFNLYVATSFLCFVILTFIVWLTINNKLYHKFYNDKILHWVENIFFMAVISVPMYLYPSYENEFKYIFLLLIIISVIQQGIRNGVATALISSILILGVDLMYSPSINGINKDFERDLVVAGVFVFVAWILGYYVEIENEKKREKEEQLYILSNELEQQDKKRLYIEEMLLKNEICYNMLFENSQSSIIVHEDGNIIYANKSAAKLFGHKNAVELNGRGVYDFYLKDKRKEAENKYFSIISDKLSKLTEEETIINSFGESIIVRNTSSYFVYEGRTTVLTLLLDISSEKQIETLKKDVEDNIKLLNETREYNKLITDFFINISHEFKTPVNVIYAALQTIDNFLQSNNEEDINKCTSYISMMKQNCYRLIRLVNNILDAAKVDSGFIKINKKNGDIVSFVEDIVSSVALYMKSKEIEIIFDTNVEERIMAFDQDKIERILLNLLSNAFKYTDFKGEINVNLEDKGNCVTVSIKDNGDGIPKDKINFIFERFVQANPSLSREREGSGIGLYLVKSFVEMHGGNIKVRSIEGIGSEFIIELPVEVAEEEYYENKNIFEASRDKVIIEFSDIYL